MDKLKIAAENFYANEGGRRLAKALKAGKHEDIDGTGLVLFDTLYMREYIIEAKRHSFMRRVYTPDYLTRSEDGKFIYLHDFEQLGPRWVKSVEEFGVDHRGWFIDDFSGETYEGVVLCFTRHGPGEGGYKHPDKPSKGHEIYMAGTRHSEWDGVTLDLDTTDDAHTAARRADRMAEREAEICREEHEKFQAEQEAERKAEEAIEEEHAI